MKLRKRWMVLVGLLLVAAGGTWLLSREAPLDLRFTGAYRFEDGRLVFVTPREGDTLRYRMTSGESAALRPAGRRTFEAGPGWSHAEPVRATVAFDSAAGRPEGLTWRSRGGLERAHRVDLPEIDGRFSSDGLELRAKLVLPEGKGPHPAVVFVHGSGANSAVDTYYNPYLAAANGIAGLVYDKRGTGGSQGRYTQNFHRLSDDTAAAVEWLRTRPEIDPANIHLAGYSQGGWIAPLAATKVAVRSLLINYGPMVPVTAEDRWGYVFALEKAGFGPPALREVDEVNAIVGRIMDYGEDRWGELEQALAAARDKAWFDAVRGSDSTVGFLATTRMPIWVLRLYAWWRLRGDEPFVDRLYDPVPTVASLETPSLWIFGGEDSSMPSDWSITELERLRAAGRPITIEVFPEAEHGILLFEEKDGERDLLGYAPGYLPLQVEWLRRQSGLAAGPESPAPSTSAPRLERGTPTGGRG
jgi:hypothetical protein